MHTKLETLITIANHSVSFLQRKLSKYVPLTGLEHRALCVKEILLRKQSSAVRKRKQNNQGIFLENKVPRNLLYFKIRTLNVIEKMKFDCCFCLMIQSIYHSNHISKSNDPSLLSLSIFSQAKSLEGVGITECMLPHPKCYPRLACS